MLVDKTLLECLSCPVLANCTLLLIDQKNKNTLLPVEKKEEKKRRKKKRKKATKTLLPVDKTVPVSFLLGDRQACAVIWKMRARVTPVMPTPAVRHRPLMATLFARVGKAGAELTAPLTSMNVKKVSNLSYSFFILECQDVQWMSRKWVTCPTLSLSLNVKKVCKPALLLVILECQGVQRLSTKWVTYPALCLSLNVKRVCKPALIFVIDPWMWVTLSYSWNVSEMWRTCLTLVEMLKSWVSDMWACQTPVYF